MYRTIALTIILLLAPGASGAADRFVTPNEEVETNVVVRQSPSTGSEALGALKPGDTAEWLGGVRGWYRIAHDDHKQAYVFKGWTDLVEATTDDDTRAMDPPRERVTFTVFVVDVGTGLAAYVRGRDFSLIYDAGTRDDSGGGTNRLLALLGKLGVAGEPVDHLVLSHPHEDHISLVPGLLDAVEIREIWDGGLVYGSCTYEELMEKIADVEATLHTVLFEAGPHEFKFTSDPPCQDTGDSVTLDLASRLDTGTVGLGEGASMTFLNVDPRDHSSANENTLVVRLNLGDVGVLLVGDAEAGGRHCPDKPPAPTSIEGELVACCERQLRSDILVVGHHGSLTSSRRTFLEAVDAKDYVVASGPRSYSGWRLPDPAVLEEIKHRQGGRLWCTSYDDEACKEATDKLGSSSGTRPGGCNTIRIDISGDGTYTINGNPHDDGVTDIARCTHPVQPGDNAPVECD